VGELKEAAEVELNEGSMTRDPEVDSFLEEGNMEQLATLVLNGEGRRLIGRQSGNPELQAFIDNVPSYMVRRRVTIRSGRAATQLVTYDVLCYIRARFMPCTWRRGRETFAIYRAHWIAASSRWRETSSHPMARPRCMWRSCSAIPPSSGTLLYLLLLCFSLLIIATAIIEVKAEGFVFK
jgi:hypothetical protein